MFRVLFLILALAGSWATLEAYNSAHAIVVSNYGFHPNKQPKQYVLFGLTKDGYLSTFGGNKDKGDKDSIYTAAREMEEEALGVLGNRKGIRKALKGAKAVCGLNNGHLSYVVPAHYYGDHVSAKFRKIRFNKNAKLHYSQKEMVDIVAVRVEEVRQKVNTGGKLYFKDNQGTLRPMRGGSEGAIKAAVAQNQI